MVLKAVLLAVSITAHLGVAALHERTTLLCDCRWGDRRDSYRNSRWLAHDGGVDMECVASDRRDTDCACSSVSGERQEL